MRLCALKLVGKKVSVLFFSIPKWFQSYGLSQNWAKEGRFNFFFNKGRDRKRGGMV